MIPWQCRLATCHSLAFHRDDGGAGSRWSADALISPGFIPKRNLKGHGESRRINSRNDVMNVYLTSYNLSDAERKISRWRLVQGEKRIHTKPVYKYHSNDSSRASFQQREEWVACIAAGPCKKEGAGGTSHISQYKYFTPAAGLQHDDGEKIHPLFEAHVLLLTVNKIRRVL